MRGGGHLIVGGSTSRTSLRLRPARLCHSGSGSSLKVPRSIRSHSKRASMQSKIEIDQKALSDDLWYGRAQYLNNDYYRSDKQRRTKRKALELVICRARSLRQTFSGELHLSLPLEMVP